MKRTLISVEPEKIADVKKAIEGAIQSMPNKNNLLVEVAIVLYAPREQMFELQIQAMAAGASSFSNT